MKDARGIAVAYLVTQGMGALLWWTLLLARPSVRRLFLPTGWPEGALLAFGLADGVLFIGLSLGCAYGLAQRTKWAWPLLCVHVGASAYAALYCVALTWQSGGQALLGTLLMLPALIVPPCLAWKLRPKETPGC